MSGDPRTISPRWRQAAIALLAWTGFTQVVYSAFLPVPDLIAGSVSLDFAGLRFGWAMGALGVAGLVAAIGVWRRASAWGRWLGVAATLVGLAYQAWLSAASGLLGMPPLQALVGILGSLLVPVSAAGVILFALLRQWDPSPRH